MRTSPHGMLWNVIIYWKGEAIFSSDYVFAGLKTLSIIQYGGSLEEGKKSICPIIIKNEILFFLQVSASGGSAAAGLWLFVLQIDQVVVVHFYL